MNARETIKDEEKVLFLLASLPKSYKLLVQSLLSKKSTLQLDKVVRLLKESQHLMDIDKSSKDN